MKAHVLYSIGDMRYVEVERPECISEWAVVKVKASGICSSDISRVCKKGTYHFPTIPGHEFSGIVDSVADKKYEKLIGERVSIFPLIPCKKCPQCLSGHYEMCSDYDYIGSRRDGGFAEYVAVPVWNLIRIPETVSFEEAAMMEPLSVALHAIKQGNIHAGDAVAVSGTGMIGLAVAHWAAKYGASTVTVIGRSETKRETVQAFGFQYEINSACNGEYDLVVEAVGSNSSVNQAIEMVKPGGRLVLMGNPENDVVLPQKTYWRILRKQLQLVGTWNSSYNGEARSDWYEVREALMKHEIDAGMLISHRFDQADLKQGIDLMREHKEPYSKVMTIWNGG